MKARNNCAYLEINLVLKATLVILVTYRNRTPDAICTAIRIQISIEKRYVCYRNMCPYTFARILVYGGK